MRNLSKKEKRKRVNIKKSRQRQAKHKAKKETESRYSKKKTKKLQSPLKSSSTKTKKLQNISKNVWLPEIFSIFKNPEETLKVFSEVLRFAKQKSPIFFHLTAISDITPDAILYMLSLFDFCDHKYGFKSFKGDFPSNSEAKNIFVESGFFKYVSLSKRNILVQHNTDILEIRDGRQVETGIAKNAIDFARDKLNLVRSNKTKRCYEIIIELMSNTKSQRLRRKIRSEKMVFNVNLR
ncbi:MAG: hypothetical protein ACUZ8H_04400 [Candidatus Anammoxibacter sp.]